MYFLVYLFLEIIVSYEFTSIFTPLGMFIEVLSSFLFGIFILKNLDIDFIENLKRVMKREISQDEFISIGIFQLIGAFLLIIPGVLTDIIGILMQFNFFGTFIAKQTLPTKYHSKKENDIIDVEIIEK